VQGSLPAFNPRFVVSERRRARGNQKGESPMALYELRTYTLHVGKMAEAVKLYQE
jgi:hypothetical protein